MTDSPAAISRFDAHVFDGPADARQGETCAFCGFPRASIIHHRSRIKATLAIVRRPQKVDAEAG